MISVKGAHMQRIAAVWHASPAKLVGALFALLLAATMAVGSGANFNSTSANPGNVVTAGNLVHVNGKDGDPILTVDKLRPGQSDNGTVTISNTGDIDGVFSIAKSVVTDSTAPGNPFAGKLRLKVEDTTAGSTLYDGVLSSMGTLAAGTLAPGATHTYKFTVSFPSGTPAQDNPFKGASLEVAFDWEAVNN
jgi:spore coat-associated protein N